MKTYRYTISNTQDPYGLVQLREKPSIGELITPAQNTRNKYQLRVLLVIHEDGDTEGPLLICEVFDWEKYHQQKR